MNFKFSAPVNIKFGENALEALNEIKGKNVFVLTTPPLVGNGTLDKVKGYLDGNSVIYTDNIEPNPSCDNIKEAVDKASAHKAEVIISLGGGSVMDTGKCVSIIMTNGGIPEDYMNGKQIAVAGLTHFCIPTTSGTGSEVTNVAVVSDKNKGLKRPVVSPYMLPKFALIVPSLTLSVPKRITAETGWDAFSHAVEAYWNKESNPISDAIARDAIKLIINNIVKAYENGSDLEARTNMSLASLMAGIAFAETRTTAMHGLSFRMTSHYNLSHGRACALTMLPFMCEIATVLDKKMNSLATYCGFKDMNSMIEDIKAKLHLTEMPVTLCEAGISEDRIEELADEGLKNKIMFLTPVDITREKVVEILRSIK